MSNRKLILTRETLRILDTSSLRAVVAGEETEACDSTACPTMQTCGMGCGLTTITKGSRGIDCGEGGTL